MLKGSMLELFAPLSQQGLEAGGVCLQSQAMITMVVITFTTLLTLL